MELINPNEIKRIEVNEISHDVKRIDVPDSAYIGKGLPADIQMITKDEAPNVAANYRYNIPGQGTDSNETVGSEEPAPKVPMGTNVEAMGSTSTAMTKGAMDLLNKMSQFSKAGFPEGMRIPKKQTEFEELHTPEEDFEDPDVEDDIVNPRTFRSSGPSPLATHEDKVFRGTLSKRPYQTPLDMPGRTEELRNSLDSLVAKIDSMGVKEAGRHRVYLKPGEEPPYGYKKLVGEKGSPYYLARTYEEIKTEKPGRGPRGGKAGVDEKKKELENKHPGIKIKPIPDSDNYQFNLPYKTSTGKVETITGKGAIEEIERDIEDELRIRTQGRSNIQGKQTTKEPTGTGQKEHVRPMSSRKSMDNIQKVLTADPYKSQWPRHSMRQGQKPDMGSARSPQERGFERREMENRLPVTERRQFNEPEELSVGAQSSGRFPEADKAVKRQAWERENVGKAGEAKVGGMSPGFAAAMKSTMRQPKPAPSINTTPMSKAEEQPSINPASIMRSIDMIGKAKAYYNRDFDKENRDWQNEQEDITDRAFRGSGVKRDIKGARWAGSKYSEPEESEHELMRTTPMLDIDQSENIQNMEEPRVDQGFVDKFVQNFKAEEGRMLDEKRRKANPYTPPKLDNIAQKDFGTVASGGFTPTFGGGGMPEKKMIKAKLAKLIKSMEGDLNRLSNEEVEEVTGPVKVTFGSDKSLAGSKVMGYKPPKKNVEKDDAKIVSDFSPTGMAMNTSIKPVAESLKPITNSKLAEGAGKGLGAAAPMMLSLDTYHPAERGWGIDKHIAKDRSFMGNNGEEGTAPEDRIDEAEYKFGREGERTADLPNPNAIKRVNLDKNVDIPDDQIAATQRASQLPPNARVTFSGPGKGGMSPEESRKVAPSKHEAEQFWANLREQLKKPPVEKQY